MQNPQEAEEAIRKVFTRARATAPCIISFDAVDVLAPRGFTLLSESASCRVKTLLSEIDAHKEYQGVFVFGETNKPHLIDPAMFGPGRFEKLFCIDLPRPFGREEILKVLTKRIPLSHLSLHAVASDQRCNGFRLVFHNSFILFYTNIVLVAPT